MARFWNIKALDDGGAEIRIDGDIVDDGDVWLYEWFGLPSASPNAFRNEIKKYKGKPLTVWIDSYGGSVFAATGMYNALREHGNITTIIDGKAMSAGFTLALAGDKVKMSMGALAMAHNPLSDPGMSNAEELRKVADVLDKVKETMLNIYGAKSKLPREKLSAIMNAETYMTPQDALELGFVDEIYENGPDKVSVKGFSRVSVVNLAQHDMEKLKEFMSLHPPRAEPNNPDAAKDGGFCLTDNGGESQPAADKTPDTLAAQRKRFTDLKRKLLEV
jgi:ATP-dependent Clp protease, protease subunit